MVFFDNQGEGNLDKIAVFDWGHVFLSYPGSLDRMADYLDVDSKQFREIFLNEISLHEKGRMTENEWLSLLTGHSPRNNVDMKEFTLFYKKAYYDAATLDIRMFEMLNEIKPYVGWTAVLSNINPVAVAIIRHKFPGFFCSFRWHFFSCEMGYVKPEPPIYHIMLKGMNAAPRDVILVDVRQENLRSAQEIRHFEKGNSQRSMDRISTIHFDRGVKDMVVKTKARLLRFFED